MVMHARKYPRLNDGYYDGKRTHPFEDKLSKTSGSFTIEKSVEASRQDNRKDYYTSKSSMSDHHKEKGNTEFRRSSSNHGGSHDRYQRDSKDYKDKDHRTEVQKSATRVCGDWSEHTSSSGKRYYYNCKTEISQWEKPKDWTEGSASKSKNGREKRNSGGHGHDSKHSTNNDHDRQSSNAKSLFNRHHSERPSSSSSHNYPHSYHSNAAPASSSSSSVSSYDKHRTSHYSGGHKPTPFSHQDSWHSLPSNSTNQSPQMGRNSRTASMDTLPVDNDVSSSADWRRDSSHSNSRHTSGQARLSLSNSFNNLPPDTETPYPHVDELLHPVNDGTQQSEDMEISPGSTPTEESMMERLGMSLSAQGGASSSTSPGSNQPHSTSSLGNDGGKTPESAAVNQLLSQINDAKSTAKPDQQALLQQAMETLKTLQRAALAQQQQKLQAQMLQKIRETLLQKTVSTAAVSSATIQTLQNLQQALLVQKHQQLIKQLSTSQSNEACPSPPSPAESDGTPSTSPKPNCSQHGSPRNGRGSPAPSQTSSQEAAVSTSQLSAANRNKDSADLTPSLSNYYCEKAVEHVTGWPGDALDRQAARYAEETHAVGSLLSTQISVDLKRSRSLVRINEIQATLQEQRLMFLRQAYKDLESTRGQTTHTTPQAQLDASGKLVTPGDATPVKNSEEAIECDSAEQEDEEEVSEVAEAPDTT